MNITVQSKIESTIFWLNRTRICIILNDYESAMDRLNRVSFELDWVNIAMLYGDKNQS